MTAKLGAIKPTLKTGEEYFLLNDQPLPVKLIEFWRWSASDLITNTSRGVLAEFIVAKALGAADGVRYDWGAFDLTAQVGEKNLKIEVKSKAFLQSWEQDKLELNPLFIMKKAQPLDSDKGKYSGEPTRQADIYVFALLAETDKSKVNPMNLNQWEFYVLRTTVLNDYKRSQHSITLKSLRNLPETIKTDFANLKQAVLKESVKPQFA